MWDALRDVVELGHTRIVVQRMWTAQGMAVVAAVAAAAVTLEQGSIE